MGPCRVISPSAWCGKSERERVRGELLGLPGKLFLLVAKMLDEIKGQSCVSGGSDLVGDDELWSLAIS